LTAAYQGITENVKLLIKEQKVNNFTIKIVLISRLSYIISVVKQ
jgi:hypothetical protein